MTISNSLDADTRIHLDAGTNPPVGVATPCHLTVFVGDAPRELLILSGVAIPEWRSDGDLDRQEVVIRLGVTTTEHYAWTANVSLAAISNDDTDFLFALDWTSVDTDPDGTLCLHVAIAAQGAPADLLRFSYQVHVLSDPIRSLVSGLISWPRQFGAPTYAVLQGGDPMFRVEVGETIPVPPTFGQEFQQTTFVPACPAGLSSKPIAAGDMWVAAYEVDNVPLGRQWEVRPALLAGALAGPPSGYLSSPSFQPMPQSAWITPSSPAATGVDFTMTFTLPPR